MNVKILDGVECEVLVEYVKCFIIPEKPRVNFAIHMSIILPFVPHSGFSQGLS